MSKKLLTMLLSVVVMIAAMPLSASADTTSDMGLSYEVYEQSTPTITEPTDTYEIAIPSIMNLNTTQDLFITANSCDIGENERLNVYLTESGSYQGGYYLKKAGSAADEGLLECNIYRGTLSNLSTPPAEKLWAGLNLVASFKRGETQPDTYGWLRFVPTNSSETDPGVYTGRVWFSFEIVNE
jgi:type 1 fimbria pilin